MNSRIIKSALVNALATALYIVVVASFLFNTPRIFGTAEPKTVLVPIMMLMLVVFSAALVGLLLFGRPLLWYFDGKQKEALSLMIATLGIFFIILVFCIIFLYSKQYPPVTVNN